MAERSGALQHRILLLILSILLNVTIEILAESSIQVTKFQVPPRVAIGEDVKLSCRYELKNEPLYRMKLFKDDQELYSYTPQSRKEDQKQAFNVSGVHVYLARSNEQDVYIRATSLRASGTYRCRVIVENTFRSALSKEKTMIVQERPLGKLFGGLDQTGSPWTQHPRHNGQRPHLISSSSTAAVQQQAPQQPTGQASGALTSLGTPPRMVIWAGFVMAAKTLLLTSRRPKLLAFLET